MEVADNTQIGADGERHPTGTGPTDAEDQSNIDVIAAPVPVRVVGGITVDGVEIGPVTLEPGDIEIGAVELKDATGANRAAINGTGELSTVDAAVRTTLTTIAGYLDTVESLLGTLGAQTDTLETLGGAHSALLTAIDGHVDGVETLLTAVDGHVDGIEGLLGTTNSTLTTIDGRVDGVETLLTAIDGHVDGLETALATGTTVPASNAAGITTREAPTAGTMGNGAQTAVSSAAVSILAANTSRKCAIIQNVGVATIRIGATGVTATTGYVSLPPGATFVLQQPYCPTAAVFAIRETGVDSIALASEIS